MNIKEYIASGILEAYALGELSANEREAVEKNLQQHPALREELSIIEQSVEALLMQAAVKPRAEVKTKLFEKIKQETAAKVIPMPPTSTAPWRYGQRSPVHAGSPTAAWAR